MENIGYATGGVLAFLGAFAFVGVLIVIVAYVFASIGLMKLAQNKGIDNAWLAWIPIGNLYIAGMIVKEVSLGTLVIPKLELILPLSVFASSVVSLIPFLGALLVPLVSIALCVLYIIVLHKLFKMYRPDSAVLFTVLSVVLGLVWLFIFIIRDDKCI